MAGDRPYVVPLFIVAFLNRAVDWGSWTLILVVAFENGGASEAGAAAAAQLLPAALAAPLVTAAGDRFDRRRVIGVASAVQGLIALGIAVTLSNDGSRTVVYALAAAFTIATLAVPAAHESLLVQYARSPSELVSWNVSSALVRQVGTFVGPALVAVMLAGLEPGPIYVGVALACGAGALVALVGLPVDDRIVVAGRVVGQEWSAARLALVEAWMGVRDAITDRSQRRVIGYMSTTESLASAVEVFLIAVAVDRLARSSGSGALLLAMVAAGAIAGSILLAIAGGRIPLARLALAGACAMVLPLLAFSRVGTIVVVGVLAAGIGAGICAAEISSNSLLQRVTPESATSRTFGVSYSAELLAGALGALVAGWSIDAVGLDDAAVLVGLAGGVLVVALAASLRRVERDAVQADADLVHRLGCIPFFAPLPLPVIERLALAGERRRHDGGEVLIAEGDVGEEFFVLLGGEVVVASGGVEIARTSAPDHFGEVALLHDEPRNATLTTVGQVDLVVIGRAEFLDAVTSSRRGRLEADAIARARSR